jgi:midasin (ATPase involved in ribosome maturation)
MFLVNLVYISNRCGKTTICQMFAALANQKLYSVNCHLNMETSDFLGGLRPVRQKPNDKVCSVANVDMFYLFKKKLLLANT